MASLFLIFPHPFCPLSPQFLSNKHFTPHYKFSKNELAFHVPIVTFGLKNKRPAQIGALADSWEPVTIPLHFYITKGDTKSQRTELLVANLSNSALLTIYINQANEPTHNRRDNE